MERNGCMIKHTLNRYWRDKAWALSYRLPGLWVLTLAGLSYAESSLRQHYNEVVTLTQNGSLPSKALVPVPTNVDTILVVTWMVDQSHLVQQTDASDSLYGRANRDIWVALESEIRPRCRQFLIEEKKNIALRIKQLLGLPPDFGGARPGGFQVIEISTGALGKLFRPCLNPDPTQAACASPNHPGPKLTIHPDHQKWMENTYQWSFIKGRFPWTRLGYTYDWGGGDEIYGVSEYIVPEMTPLRILEWVPLDQFCAVAP